jgi:O-antigen ligase
LPATKLDPFLLAYVACYIVVLPFSIGRHTSLVWLVALLANVLLFYAVVATTRSAASWAATLLLAIVVGTAVLEIIGIDFHLERGIFTRMAEYERPEGWSGYPELGYLLCVQIAILMAIFQTTPGRLHRWGAALMIGVGILELVFLYSRLAWITAAALLLVAAVAGRPLRSMWRPIAGTIVVALLAGAVIAQTQTGSQLLTSVTKRAASAGRLDIWQRTAALIHDHPWTGVGAGNFQAVFEPVYNPVLNNDLRRGGHAHNLWLQQAAELGLFTAAVYAVLWVAVVLMAARQINGSWVQRAAFLVLVVVVVRNMGDYMFFSTGSGAARLHTLLWIVWGVVGAEAFSLQRASPLRNADAGVAGG